jgi:thiamine pyrophosphate-dependent acetolactate synthase large subunit-like protein
MARISGRQALVRALEAEGVDTVFGLTGHAVFAVFDACPAENAGPAPLHAYHGGS